MAKKDNYVPDDETLQSKQVDGRFVTPWGGGRPSLNAVFRWLLIEKRERNIGKAEELDRNLPVLSIDKSVLDHPTPDSIQITWLGHATVLVQLENINILTDPCLNNCCGPLDFLGKKRYRPSPCTVGELPEIHAVCVSHNHYDHLDFKTVTELNDRFGKALRWYVPMGLRGWMVNAGCNNVIEMEWWESHDHVINQDGSTVKFIFTPTQHWSRRGLKDENKSLWGSWCVIGAKRKFFFAGDTGYYEKVFKQIGQRCGPFDLSAIPIGAYKPRWFLNYQHIDPIEAVQIHEDIGSALSVGIHWGTYPFGYEHYMAPPQDLKTALQQKGIHESNFITLKHGETKIVNTEDTVV